eukprot:17679-Heterococcus_DN1.PRE.3
MYIGCSDNSYYSQFAMQQLLVQFAIVASQTDGRSCVRVMVASKQRDGHTVKLELPRDGAFSSLAIILASMPWKPNNQSFISAYKPLQSSQHTACMHTQTLTAPLFSLLLHSPSSETCHSAVRLVVLLLLPVVIGVVHAQVTTNQVSKRQLTVLPHCCTAAAAVAATAAFTLAAGRCYCCCLVTNYECNAKQHRHCVALGVSLITATVAELTSLPA